MNPNQKQNDKDKENENEKTLGDPTGGSPQGAPHDSSHGAPPHVFEIKKWGYKGQLLPSYYFQPNPGVDSTRLRMTNISV